MGSWKNNYCLSWSSPSSMNPIQIVTKNFLQTQFSPLSPKIGPIPIILGQFPRWLLSFRTFSFLITERNHRNCEASFFPSPPLNESLLSRPDMNYHPCHIPESSIGMLLLQKSGYIKVIGFYSNVFLRIAQRELSIQKHWLLFFLLSLCSTILKDTWDLKRSQWFCLPRINYSHVQYTYE